MHHKVIMDNFPKTAQNRESDVPTNCLLTLTVKIALCNWEAAVFERDLEPGLLGWCLLQFITVANYLCCKSTLSHRKKGGKKEGREQTSRHAEQWNHQLHADTWAEQWKHHMSGLCAAGWLEDMCLLQREMKTGSGSGAPASKSHLFRQQQKICHCLIIHSWISHLKIITQAHNILFSTKNK